MHMYKAGYPRKYPKPISPFSKNGRVPLPAIIFFTPGNLSAAEVELVARRWRCPYLGTIVIEKLFCLPPFSSLPEPYPSRAERFW
jgi:hypothetical protein